MSVPYRPWRGLWLLNHKKLKNPARDCNKAKPCGVQSLPVEGCVAKGVIGQNGRGNFFAIQLEKERAGPDKRSQIRPVAMDDEWVM